MDDTTMALATARTAITASPFQLSVLAKALNNVPTDRFNGLFIAALRCGNYTAVGLLRHRRYTVVSSGGHRRSRPGPAGDRLYGELLVYCIRNNLPTAATWLITNNAELSAAMGLFAITGARTELAALVEAAGDIGVVTAAAGAALTRLVSSWGSHSGEPTWPQRRLAAELLLELGATIDKPVKVLVGRLTTGDLAAAVAAATPADQHAAIDVLAYLLTYGHAASVLTLRRALAPVATAVAASLPRPVGDLFTQATVDRALECVGLSVRVDTVPR